MATLFHLKAWWSTLDTEWQELLMHAVGAEGTSPNEQDIFSIFQLKTIFMDVPGDHDDPQDVEMFELKTLAPLRMLADLESLTIQGKVKQIYSLDPIKDSVNLKQLSIHGTSITDISPLRSLINLESISFNRSQIADISPLADLPKLRSVNAIESEVASLQPLSGRPALSSINIWGPNLTSYAIDQFAQANPRCDINSIKQALEDTKRWNEQPQYRDGYDFDDEELSEETYEMERIFNIIEDGLNNQIAEQLRLGNVYRYTLMLDIENDTYEVIFDYINQKAKIHVIRCASWEYDVSNDLR